MTHVKEAEAHVAVIGLGYVGLPTALMFADAGLSTVGVDVNEAIVAQLSAGQCSINEHDVVELFGQAKTRQNFRAATRPPVAEAYILAVPTPLDKRRKMADLSMLISATESILPVLKAGALVIVESTVPPLTCREIVEPVLARSGLQIGRDVLVAHCPERLFPGNSIFEIINNARIIGGANEEANRRTLELYRHFVKGPCHLTDDVTAEFCKLAENAYRDVNIALASEMATVADQLGISITEAIRLANQHPRVEILKPGIGVGGHCIPIDPWFLAEVAPGDSTLIATARKVNDHRPVAIAGKIRQAVAAVAEPRIGCYGVTYKANVNDVRSSPARIIIDLLRQDGYQVDVYDPVAHVGEAGSLFDFARGKDALAVLVEHEEIARIMENEPDKLLKCLNHPILLRF